MNIHHLELFYYVARFGGIAEAVRRMPYGIQQPAISVQLIQLEKDLGATLFRRRPFELTAAGKELFAFAEPFFSRIDEVAARLRGENEQRIRIGAAPTIIRDYLPKVLNTVRKNTPKMRVVLREGHPHELLDAVDQNEIDLAVVTVDRVPAGLRKAVLARLRPQLLFHGSTPPAVMHNIFARDGQRPPLIALPPGEPISRLFQKELSRRRIEWTPTIEVSALDVVAAYVLQGFGVGLSVAAPEFAPPGAKALVLETFPAITLTVVWRNLLAPVSKQLVEAMSKEAKALGF
jgi:DNA-binding transcriptional LysR family regulator